MRYSFTKTELSSSLPGPARSLYKLRKLRAARLSVSRVVASDQSSKRKKASRASRSSKASSVNLKLQKDGVNVAGCSNGDILFQFGGARAANHPSSTSLGTLSVGQQWQVTSKLRKLIAGQEADLSFQLWDDWSADVSSSNSDHSSSFTDSSSGTHSSLHANGSDATPSFANGHDQHHSDARQTEDRMIRAIAQGVLSTQETADGNQELATLSSNGYSAASSRQWYTPPPSFQPDGPEHQQGTSSQDAVYSSMESDEASPRQDTHYSASTSASSLASEQPATSVDRNISRRARRRLRERYIEGADAHTAGLGASAGQSEPTAPPVTYPWPRALSKKESHVPCYKWHEAGPPIRTLLSAPQSKAISTADEDADSDTEDAAASEALTAEHDVFPTRRQLQELSEKNAQSSMLVFLRPVLRLAVGLWRLLPYWVRHLLRSGRGRRLPALHASPTLSEHIRSGRRDAVPGSSFNPASGRSATPLADLPRHRIEDLVGCGVRDVRLYQTALSAPSAVEPDHMIAQSFDRLEYLGDAVVQVVFGSYIYQRFPDDDAGSMTHTMSTLASNRAHEQYASHLGLGRYVATNLKYMRPGFSVNPDVQADAFEALVGAIYLDRGFKIASNFLTRVAENVMGMDTTLSSYRNYKLYFITNVNQANMGRITYVTKQNRSNKMWLSKCLLENKLVGMGLDKMPKQAEAAAAYAAMKQLNITETTSSTKLRRPVTIR